MSHVLCYSEYDEIDWMSHVLCYSEYDETDWMSHVLCYSEYDEIDWMSHVLCYSEYDEIDWISHVLCYSEYDEIDWRADDQYWASESTLRVQGVETHAPVFSWPQSATDGEPGTGTGRRQTHSNGISQIAVKQLERFVGTF